MYLLIESAVRGLLMVNGQFCGPVDAQGQTFPAGKDAEIYIQFFPLTEDVRALTVEMILEKGKIIKLEPQSRGYALVWPDDIIELELHPDGAPQNEETEAVSGVLLRYLTLRLNGDERAEQMIMRPVSLPTYEAVVPLRFAPLRAPERFDERAGLVKRIAPNIARVDAALAMTVPAGQGRRMIEQIEVMQTSIRDELL